MVSLTESTYLSASLSNLEKAKSKLPHPVLITIVNYNAKRKSQYPCLFVGVFLVILQLCTKCKKIMKL